MSDRYVKLYQHAERAYEQVTQAMAELTGQLETTQHQLESLQTYARTLAQPAQQHAEHHQLLQQRLFVHQVLNAIAHQQQQVEQLQQQLEQMREQWLQKRAELKGLEKMIENNRLREQKLEAKVAQRAEDARSSWMHHQRKTDKGLI